MNWPLVSRYSLYQNIFSNRRHRQSERKRCFSFILCFFSLPTICGSGCVFWSKPFLRRRRRKWTSALLMIITAQQKHSSLRLACLTRGPKETWYHLSFCWSRILPISFLDSMITSKFNILWVMFLAGKITVYTYTLFFLLVISCLFPRAKIKVSHAKFDFRPRPGIHSKLRDMLCIKRPKKSIHTIIFLIQLSQAG